MDYYTQYYNLYVFYPEPEDIKEIYDIEEPEEEYY